MVSRNGLKGRWQTNDEYRLTIPEPLYDDLVAHVLRSGQEEVALLFANQAQLGTIDALIVRRWEPVPTEMLIQQQADVFAVNSDFIVSRVKIARQRQESVLLAHSHPLDHSVPRFSRADSFGEDNLYPLLQMRLLSRIHGAIVISPGGHTARFVLPDGTRTPVDEIRVVGRRLRRTLVTPQHEEELADEAHARQQLIWGTRGQSYLRNASIGVVGVGGTGSIVAQQLIHLGVGRLTVIDNQIVEESNLSRIVGAQRSDIDLTAKVDVVKRVANGVDPTIEVTAIQGDVTNPTVLAALRSVDLLFLCTDKHYSRMVVNSLAVQYAIPLVDLGFLIDIEPSSGYVISAVGEVRIVVPGGYCLSCVGVLDAERIKAEKATPDERNAYPAYFSGIDVPDPSVITLNSTIASLAVTVGCDMLVPTMRPVNPRDSYRYNALKGLVTNVEKEHHPGCGICSSEGRAATGDQLPLPQ